MRLTFDQKSKVAQAIVLSAVTFTTGKFLLKKFSVLISIISVMVSWDRNHNILWVIFHWFTGFWYLLYSLLDYRFANGAFLEILKSFI